MKYIYITFQRIKNLIFSFSGCEDSLDKSDLFSRHTSDSEDSDNENSQITSNKHISRRKIPEQQISPFLDLTYWKK